MQSITPTGLVDAAMRKLGAVQADESPTTDEVTDGVQAANLLIDTWSTQGLTIPTNVREVFPVSSGQTVLTIGSGAALDTVRPTDISAASILLNAPSAKSCTITSASGVATVTCTSHGYSTGMAIMILGAAQAAYNGLQIITVTSANAFTYPVVGSPTTPATGTITARDTTGDNSTDEMYLSRWTYSGYIAEAVKGTTSPYPTNFYYEKTYDTQWGRIFLWPSPNQANVMVFYMPRPLAELSTTALTTAVYMPPGCIRALIYNLAIELAPEFGVNVQTIPTVVQLARESLAEWKRYNDPLTVMSTGDAGVLFGHGVPWGNGASYNIYSGP